MQTELGFSGTTDASILRFQIVPAKITTGANTNDFIAKYALIIAKHVLYVVSFLDRSPG